jgi:hypothetical protein
MLRCALKSDRPQLNLGVRRTPVEVSASVVPSASSDVTIQVIQWQEDYHDHTTYRVEGDCQ